MGSRGSLDLRPERRSRVSRAGRVLGAVALLAVVAGIGRASAAPAPSPIGTHQDELVAATERMVAARDTIDSLLERSGSDVKTLRAAGDELTAATEQAFDVLDLYRTDNVTEGTYGELSAMRGLEHLVVEATNGYGELLGAGDGESEPPKKERDKAKKEVDKLEQAVRDELDYRFGVEGVADVLKKPTFKRILGKAVERLDNQLQRKLNAKLRKITGLPILLGVPLKRQIQWAKEDLINDALDGLLFDLGPAGILVNVLTGGKASPAKLVKLVGKKLKTGIKKAFRGKKNLEGRTGRSVAGLSAISDRILGLAPETPIGELRKLLIRGQRELGRTGFLEADLRRRGREDLASELSDAIDQLAVLVASYRNVLESDRFGVTYRKVAKLFDKALVIIGELQEENLPERFPPPWRWEGTMRGIADPEVGSSACEGQPIFDVVVIGDAGERWDASLTGIGSYRFADHGNVLIKTGSRGLTMDIADSGSAEEVRRDSDGNISFFREIDTGQLFENEGDLGSDLWAEMQIEYAIRKQGGGGCYSAEGELELVSSGAQAG